MITGMGIAEEWATERANRTGVFLPMDEAEALAARIDAALREHGAAVLEKYAADLEHDADRGGSIGVDTGAIWVRAAWRNVAAALRARAAAERKGT